MPIQDMKDQVNLEMDITVDDVFRFCKIREQIRKQRNADQDWYSNLDVTETERDVLKNSRMNNIFRDHDKVTVALWDKLDESMDDYTLWRNILIGRFINRKDRIDEAWPLKEDWFIWGPKDPLVNSAAYQLNPGLGKAFGVKTVRECVPLLDTKVQPTYEAVLCQGSQSIEKATVLGNTAFGGYVVFMMFQAILDISMFRPNLIDPYSEIIVGQGAHATERALGLTTDEFKSRARQLWPEHLEVRPNGLTNFDVENIYCEFRKFMKRQVDGIPGNRRYKRKMQYEISL